MTEAFCIVSQISRIQVAPPRERGDQIRHNRYIVRKSCYRGPPEESCCRDMEKETFKDRDASLLLHAECGTPDAA